MSDDMNEVRRKRGRPPKIQAAPSDDEAFAFVNEYLRRPIDARTESRKLEPTEDILMVIGEFAKFGSTKREIAAVLAVSVSALEEFMGKSIPARNAYERGIEFSNIRVRVGQYKLADKFANMAAFLGKNKLGQKDEVTTNVKTETTDVKEMSEEQLWEIAGRAAKDARSDKFN